MYKVIIYLLNLIPRKKARKILYFLRYKKRLNLSNPKDFNEKINWLMYYKYGKKESNLTDKFKVKDIVEKLSIKDLNIPKVLKIYQNANEINLIDLPEQFVLKCNNGCGDVFICTDKSVFNLEIAKKKLNKNLKKDFSKENFEFHYSDIKPCILCEEYLKDKTNINPIDYKFYCFDGKVDSLLVCSNREKKLKLNHFDTNWQQCNFVKEQYKSQEIINKPENFNKMIEIVEQLCKKLKLDFCRVDLYNINGNIYLGELTFTPAMGMIKYYNQKALNYLGSKISIRKEGK